MQVKHWGFRLMLGLVLFAGVLSCRLSDTLLAQAQPTTTPTRTPRPTFTPPPPPSPTIIPPTVAKTVTRTPTRAPTRAPTAKPVVVPTSPPAPAQPTTPPYHFKSANKGCEHSGQTFIQGTVYDVPPSTSPLNGVTVVMSGSPDGAIADQKQSGTDGDGFYSMIVSAYGAANGEKRWVWVVEGGKRASDIVEFDFNNLKEDNPQSCFRGFVDFVKLY